MEKKSNKGLIIIIVVLTLLLVGVSGYLVYDKIFSKDEVKEVAVKEKTEEIDIDNNKSEEISLTELENYSNIYNIVNDAIINNEMVMHLPLNNQADYFYQQDKIYVDEIRSDVLMSMVVSQLKMRNIDYIDGVRTYYIENDDMEKTFIDTFGNSREYSPISFSMLGCSYNYDEQLDRYIVPCGDGGNVVASKRENKIVKVIKTNDSIEVYDAVAFIGMADGKICKDVKFKDCIATLHELDDFNIDNYISKLNQYKYIFKLNSDGNYYFYGVELVK